MQRLLESIEGRLRFPAPDPALQVRQGPGNPRIRSQWTARSPSGGSTIRRNRFAVLGPRSTSEGPPWRSREDARPAAGKRYAHHAQFRTRKAASGESAPVLLQGPPHSVPRTRNHISGDKRECRNTIPRTSNPGRTHSYIRVHEHTISPAQLGWFCQKGLPLVEAVQKQSGPFGQASGTHASLARHLPAAAWRTNGGLSRAPTLAPAIQPRRDTSTASIFASLSNLRSRMISLFYGAVPDDRSTALPAVSLRSDSAAVSRTSSSSSERAPCKAGIISGPPIRARP
jgi:hypothetical protein